MSWLKGVFDGGEVKEKGDSVYGTYSSYPVMAKRSTSDNSVIICIYFQCPEEYMESLRTGIESRSNELKMVQKNFQGVKLSNQEIQLLFGKTMMNRTAKKNAKMALDRMVGALKRNICSPACEGCGQDIPTDWYMIGGIPRCLCKACCEKVTHACEVQDEIERSIPVNYTKGTLGAFIGAIFAGLCYAVSLRFGFILLSTILPIFPTYCFHYYGKRIDKLGSIITAVLSIIIFYIATRIGFVWRIQAKAFTDFSFIEVYKYIDKIMDIEEVQKLYNECMIKGFGLACLVTVVIAGAIFFDNGKTKITELK